MNYSTSDTIHEDWATHLGWTSWENCSAPAILEFPDPHLGNIGILPASLILVYLYVVLAVICDSHFLPGLRRLCDSFGISSDVAGATLMAATASAPELALCCVGTFLTEADIGASAIVGSAVFNMLLVPAFCAFLAAPPQGTKIDNWSFTRDSLMYAISLLCLALSCSNDQVEWYEAFLMLFIYILYVTGMQVDKRIRRKTIPFFKKIMKNDVCCRVPLLSNSSTPYYSSSGCEFFSSCDEAILATDGRSAGPGRLEEAGGSGKPGLLLRVSRLMVFPVDVITGVTVPKSPVWLCLFLSIAWIAALTYLISYLITYIGYQLGIPDSLMGLTVLGVGLGIPELMSSMVATKRGKGTMGLSNALGANTFNTLVCLGLTWLLKAAFSPQHTVLISTDGLTYSCSLILFMLFLTALSLYLNSFVLDKKIGCLLCSFYLVFLVSSILLEMNVFFKVNLPLCNIKDYYND